MDPAATLAEPNYFAQQMYETWGDRLRVTEDENDFACRQGFAALRQYDGEMERRGRELLETARRRTTPLGSSSSAVLITATPG